MPATSIPFVPHSGSRRAAWLGGNMPVARLGLILNLLVPLALLAWDAHKGRLGADPVNDALHTTGLVAVTCLVLSLCITPLRMLSGWTWLVQFRRSLGVFAFYYGCAHLAIYFWWDRGHSLHSTVYEIVHRYYLAIGFASLALMAPLWATSLNAAIQAMGATSWRRLHRLAYVAAALACYHFYLQSKADKRRPDVYIAVLAGLLLWRVGAAAVRRLRAPARATNTAKSSFWKGELKVASISRETDTVRTFRLAPPDGGSIPFVFKAGQFLNLSLEVDGRRVSRSYTIASPPTRDDYIELTIKREDRGLVSHFLHDTARVGQLIACTAPAGRFSFEPESSDAVLLIAGGVGITPLMSILRDLTDRGWPGMIDLVFSVRSPADVIFRDELRDLANRHPNLRVHLTATRDFPNGWTGFRGRITGAMLRQCVPDAVRLPAFVCGPNAMADAVRDELIALGLPKDRIHVESFTPALAVATAGTARTDSETSAATVTFSLSNRSVPIPMDRTVLEAAESAGVPIDYQCRSGICGTCRCKLLTGSVTMSTRDALSDADVSNGYILACQSHATETITVEA